MAYLFKELHGGDDAALSAREHVRDELREARRELALEGTACIQIVLQLAREEIADKRLQYNMY